VFASQACWGTAVPDAFNRPSGLMLAISHTCLRSQATRDSRKDRRRRRDTDDAATWRTRRQGKLNGLGDL
jgi:hypothetical protein